MFHTDDTASVSARILENVRRERAAALAGKDVWLCPHIVEGGGGAHARTTDFCRAVQSRSA